MNVFMLDLKGALCCQLGRLACSLIQTAKNFLCQNSNAWLCNKKFGGCQILCIHAVTHKLSIYEILNGNVVRFCTEVCTKYLHYVTG